MQPSPASDQQLYQVDERVFAEDNTGIYEAVIKKVKLKQATLGESSSPSTASPAVKHEWSYRVHYLGWNSRWDRWTDGSDLRPDTPEVRAEAERRQEEAAQRERERKAKQKERREQKLRQQQQQRKRKKLGGGADNSMAEVRTGSHGASSPIGGVSSKRRRLTSSPAGDSCSSKGDNETALTKEYVQSTLEECCTLPFTLKRILVDDKVKLTRLGYYVASGYDNVESIPNWTPPRKVHVLPSQLPVKLVLKQFWKEKKKTVRDKAKAAVARLAKTKEAEEGSGFSDLNASDIASIKERSVAEEEKWKAFIKGILDVFNEGLPPFLLYKQERTHYLAAKMDPNLLRADETDEGLSAQKKPSDVYGAEHLLRLFVRLPQIVPGSEDTLFPDQASLNGFADGISDLIVFLQRNSTACFKGRYRDTREIEWTAEEAEVVKRCAAPTTSQSASGDNGAADPYT